MEIILNGPTRQRNDLDILLLLSQMPFRVDTLSGVLMQSRIARQGKHGEQDHRDGFFICFFFCLPSMIIKSLHTDSSRYVCHSILDPISAR